MRKLLLLMGASISFVGASSWEDIIIDQAFSGLVNPVKRDALNYISIDGVRKAINASSSDSEEEEEDDNNRDNDRSSYTHNNNRPSSSNYPKGSCYAHNGMKISYQSSSDKKQATIKISANRKVITKSLRLTENKGKYYRFVSTDGDIFIFDSRSQNINWLAKGDRILFVNCPKPL